MKGWNPNVCLNDKRRIGVLALKTVCVYKCESQRERKWRENASIRRDAEQCFSRCLTWPSVFQPHLSLGGGGGSSSARRCPRPSITPPSSCVFVVWTRSCSQLWLKRWLMGCARRCLPAWLPLWRWFCYASGWDDPVRHTPPSATRWRSAESPIPKS